MRNYPQVRFVVDIKKERWFIQKKYDSAREKIGLSTFNFIIDQNVSGISSSDIETVKKMLCGYVTANRVEILAKLQKSKGVVLKRWKRYEKNFWRQMVRYAGMNLKTSKINIHLLFSCFWGGDYDLYKQNVYINPLLKFGDPLYVIFHEISHLFFWQDIERRYGKKFLERNQHCLWPLSEVVVNYPLMKLRIGFAMPLIIPPSLKKYAKHILSQFSRKRFSEIIDREIKKLKTESV